MIVLVCGGRDFCDRAWLDEALNAVHAALTVTLIRHGGASGADSLSGEWAAARGIAVDEHPAAWYVAGRLNRSAGFERNAQMARLPTDACIAFAGGNGTAHMVATARRRAIPVWVALSPRYPQKAKRPGVDRA